MKEKTKPSRIGPTLSFQAKSALAILGENIRTARLRRGESETLMAERVGVSRDTWRRLESGSPSVSLGLFVEAMCVLGFTQTLFELADPQTDTMGIAADAARRPQRGRSAPKGKP